MVKITDLDAFDADEAVSPPPDIDSMLRPDQSFIIALNTEAAPIMLEEYNAALSRATVDHPLRDGGMTAPPSVGLPNAQHDLFPYLGEQMPAYGAQAHYRGANNPYRPRFMSNMMGIGPRAGVGNLIYPIGQNYAPFPMSSYYPNAYGSYLPFGLAQYPFNQAPIHQTGFPGMLMLPHVWPTAHYAQYVFYGEPNPHLVYANEDPMELMEQLHDPSMVEYSSEGELEGMQLTEDGFGLPTIPEDEVFPRVPYFGPKLQQVTQPIFLQNQPMIPPPIVTATVLPDHPQPVDSSLLNSLAALNEAELQNATFDAPGLYQHEQSSVPEFAMRGATPIEPARVWAEHGFMSREIATESIFLPQGQANTFSRIVDTPRFAGPYDPRHESMSLPRDPRIRPHPASHHGNTAQSQDGNSSVHTP